MPRLEALEDRTVLSGGLVGNLVVFGDSLSDTGNAALATGGALPNPALYYQGRFSNGPIWVDTLAKYLGEPAVQPSLAGGSDYAFGGATVAYQNQPPPFNAFPRVSQQVGQYLAGHAPAANDLIVVWGGANDFIESFSSPTGPINPILSADTLESSLETLATAGGRQFVVPNLPALGETPFIRGLGIPGLSAAADQWTAAFDAELAADLGNFKSGHPDATVVSLDVAGLFQQATQPSNPFGFVNTTDAVGPLVPGSPFLAAVTATDPQDYLFFDGIHPTSKTHQLGGVEAAAGVYDALGVQHLVVTSTADTVDPTASGLSLREMVNLSNAMHGQQTITFDLGPGPQQINLSGKDLPIMQDLTIRGLGADDLTISGNAASRVFDISGGPTVTISGLTIADGFVQGDVQGGGGGILNESGASLNISDMAFTGNVAIPNAVPTGNGAIAGGGAILNQSGASLNVSGSTFTGNQAFGVVGGGIWDQFGSTATVTDSVFTNNQVVGVLPLPGLPLTEGEGGGIDNDGTLTVSHSTFVNNQAIGGSGLQESAGSGGGIGNDGTLTVTASSFIGNQSVGGGGTDAFAIGGGISNFFSLTVTASSFTGNQAVGVHGAGFAGGGGIDNIGTGSVTASSFTGNQAIANSPGGVAFGGAMESEAASTSLTVSNSTFADNQASGFTIALGGAISSFTTSSLTNSTFINNQAIGSGLGASVGGGALDNEILSMTVTNSTLTGNEAIGGDGGDGITTFSSASGGGITSPGALTVLNSTLTDNLVVGGVLAPGAPTSVSTANGGGGINFFGPTLTLANSSLVGNQVVGCSGGAGGAGSIAIGGGITVSGTPSTATITNCSLSDNSAVGGAGGSGAVGGAGVGGGIDVSFGSTATITGTTLTDNHAAGGAGGAGANGGAGLGGGISVGSAVLFGMPDTSSVTVDGSSLDHNKAIGGDGGAGGSGGNGLGGGLVALAGTATISNSSLDHNRAVGGEGEDGGSGGNGFGGGVYVASGATVSVTGSTITHNRARGGEGDDGGSDGQGIGGGVYNLGTFTFDVTTVIDHNHASTSNDDIFP